MKDYISTWIYLDTEDEKSHFPQVGGDSSNKGFQNVYWRCVVVFFETSLRYNEGKHHILFTNSPALPVVDGLDLSTYCHKNEIEVVTLDNLYPLPEDYHTSFRNQFFEFSIIDYLSKSMIEGDKILLLDSDCIFTKAIDNIYDELRTNDAATYVYEYAESHKINGITRIEMKKLFNQFGHAIDEIPFYCAGEILLASDSFIKKVAHDFATFYKQLLALNDKGELKFNEEAHVLSYYYYVHNAKVKALNKYIKRLWTDRKAFRNVKKEDRNLAIWHLPAEKNNGILDIFNLIATGKDIKKYEEDKYQNLIYKKMLKSKNWIYKIKKKLSNL